VTAIDLSGGQVRASDVTVNLSNTGKVLFPGDGITQGELIEYYGHVADWMRPYLRVGSLERARRHSAAHHSHRSARSR
jgi:DNA primase